MKKIAILSLLLLITICLYSYYYHNNYYPSLSDFLSNPAKYGGMRMELTGYARNTTANSFYLERNGLKIEVRGIGVSEGAYLGVAGTLKHGYLQAENYRLNYSYALKYLLSFAGFIMLAFFFFKEWKLTTRGFEHA